MAISEERLIAVFEAQLNKYFKDLDKAKTQTDRTLGGIEKRSVAMEKQMRRMAQNSGADVTALGRRLVAVFAGSRILQGMKNFSDAATRIDNSLKVAGLSGQNLEATYDALRDSAVKNSAPIESLVELYSRAATVQNELGVSSQELLGFVDKVALALRVSGKSASESSGALLQLSQSLGSGVVRAEEFNSILDGALPIAQAAAAGLKEAGGSVARLRQLVIDGKVSSEAFFRAFEAGSPILEKRASGAVLTVSQGFENLQTALIDSVREFNKATGASESFALGINKVAQAISDVAFDKLIARIGEARNEFETFMSQVGNADVFTRLGQIVGAYDADGNIINPAVGEAQQKISGLERDIGLLQQKIEQNTSLGFDNTEAMQRLAELKSELISIQAYAANLSPTLSGINVVAGAGLVPEAVSSSPSGGPRRGGRRGAAAKAVSLKDFKPPSGSGSGGGAKQSDYERTTESIQKRIAATQAETAALAGINPLIDDYGFAVSQATTAQDLLTAAQQTGLAAGKELTDVQQLLSGDFEDLSPKAREQAAAMLALATELADASTASNRLKSSQDEIRRGWEDFKSLSKDTTKSFISDLVQGKSAADALANALANIGAKFADLAFDREFDAIFGGGPSVGRGGLFGGAIIPGILHSGGIAGRDGYGHGRTVSPSVFANAPRYHSGAIAGMRSLRPNEVPAILERGEPVLPKGSKLGGGSGGVTNNYYVNAPGAEVGTVNRIEKALGKMDSEFDRRAVTAVNRRQSRGYI